MGDHDRLTPGFLSKQIKSSYKNNNNVNLVFYGHRKKVRSVVGAPEQHVTVAYA